MIMALIALPFRSHYTPNKPQRVVTFILKTTRRLECRIFGRR